MASELMKTTYSMWRQFRNCRMACKLRYIDCLVPLKRDNALAFGSLIHECLEMWHKHRDLKAVLKHIDTACVKRDVDERGKYNWQLARAMMEGYAAQYPEEEFKVIALEGVFSGAITNPATGAASRSFSLSGKFDGLVKIDDDYFLLEHKTAASIDGAYIERLWTDFQIILYSYYIEKEFKIKISGILYNVLQKAKIKQGAGETEQEFEERRAALIAKSKTGKSSAKRKLAEPDEDFFARLREKYDNPEMFHRERLFISRDQFDELREELWELSQAMLEARRRGKYYRNTSWCFQYNRPCAYYEYCRSGGNPNIIENLFEVKPPHEELREEQPLAF